MQITPTSTSAVTPILDTTWLKAAKEVRINAATPYVARMA